MCYNTKIQKKISCISSNISLPLKKSNDVTRDVVCTCISVHTPDDKLKRERDSPSPSSLEETVAWFVMWVWYYDSRLILLREIRSQPERNPTRCSSAGEDRSPALSTQNEMPFYYVRGDPGAVILWRNMCARQAHVERDDMNMIGAHANLDHSDHLSLFPGRPSSR